MRVSPINVFSARTYPNRSIKNNPEPVGEQVAFKGASYQKAFNSAIQQKFEKTKDVSVACENLMNALKSEGLIKNNFLKNLSFASIVSALKYIDANDSLGNECNIYDEHSHKVVQICREYMPRIFFKNPNNKYIFEVYLDDNELYASQICSGSSNSYTFYNERTSTGNLKRYLHASGSGIGATSEELFFNEDGSPREFRNFIRDIFGL